MKINKIQKSIEKIIKSLNEKTFIYDLLLAYNLPKSTISRLKKGSANLSKVEGEISLKKKLFFREEYNEDLHIVISDAKKSIKNHQRFIIVTNYRTFLAVDTKLNTSLDILLKDLPKHYDFFLPWSGIEKSKYEDENPADLKAASKMGKLYYLINKDNNDSSNEFKKELNVFLARLLFCYFSEDTNIFSNNQFTNSVASNTLDDGSDLNTFLDRLFKVLDTPKSERNNLPEFLNSFPYVNGNLFKEEIKSPKFTKSSRKVFIEIGSLNWSEINPDIFGSMFQAVSAASEGENLGQHFTSVPNIMKVINPLFLDELYEEFENAEGNDKKLNKLLYRIRNIKIFDPACGSGNFLIITYKELRRLEMKIFKEMGSLALSDISLNQFYGIEIDDFASEIARVALWLAKHQMSVEFFKQFGRNKSTLPLSESGNIVHGNACRLDWEEVCPKNENDEIYILGNPPYLGSSMQNKNQKEDLKIVLSNIGSYKNLDYIACWFKNASDYITDSNSSFAFVSTNSICQGEQVALLWPYIFNRNQEIGFAHQSFYWNNNAKNSAAVIVVIVGLRNLSNHKKTIIKNGIKQYVNFINPYLTKGNAPFLKRRNDCISNLPAMLWGNKASDGGNLILTEEEKIIILENFPQAERFIKKYIGSQEFIKGIDRWCLWVSDEELDIAYNIPSIRERIDKVREMRLSSKAPSTRKASEYSHKFIQINTSHVLLL